MYRWTSLYSRARDFKNRLAYDKLAYKKAKDTCKFEDRFRKKAILRKIADKKALLKLPNSVEYSLYYVDATFFLFKKK